MDEFCRKRDKVIIGGAIDAMQEIVRIRDVYTFDHMIGVSKIVSQIADIMKMDNAGKENLVIAALLHDVGKVAVPAEILNKSGSLDEAEWVLMRNHVNIGVDIVKKMCINEEIIRSIAEHHERLDGKGYPNGIQDISIGGRILAVADVMDSMIRHRPYRSALKFDDFIEEIANEGKYDKEVVKAAINIIRKKERSIWSTVFSNKRKLDLKEN